MRINQAAFSRAARELGLRRGIRVSVDQHLPAEERGTYKLTDDGKKHRIRLNASIMNDREQALRTFLHELRHAAQHDHGDSDLVSDLAYTLADALLGYNDNPYEADARAWAEDALPRYTDLLEF